MMTWVIMNDAEVYHIMWISFDFYFRDDLIASDGHAWLPFFSTCLMRRPWKLQPSHHQRWRCPHGLTLQLTQNINVSAAPVHFWCSFAEETSTGPLRSWGLSHNKWKEWSPCNLVCRLRTTILKFRFHCSNHTSGLPKHILVDDINIIRYSVCILSSKKMKECASRSLGNKN